MAEPRQVRPASKTNEKERSIRAYNARSNSMERTPIILQELRRLQPGHERFQPIWLRLPNESEKAYAAFRFYRDGGLERSLRAVDEHYGRSCAPAISGITKQWSVGYCWRERVSDFDQFEREMVQEKAAVLEAENEVEMEAVDDGIGVWASRAVDLRDRKYKIGNAMLKYVEGWFKTIIDAPVFVPGDGISMNATAKGIEGEKKGLISVTSAQNLLALAKSAAGFMQEAIDPVGAIEQNDKKQKGATSSAQMDISANGLPMLPADLSEASDDQIKQAITVWNRQQPKVGKNASRTQ